MQMWLSNAHEVHLGGRTASTGAGHGCHRPQGLIGAVHITDVTHTERVSVDSHAFTIMFTSAVSLYQQGMRQRRWPTSRGGDSRRWSARRCTHWSCTAQR